MTAHTDAAQHLWSALDELDEWFRRLGGANRDEGFRNVEVPTAVLILLQSRFSSVASARAAAG
jgi:hypothetical protein